MLNTTGYKFGDFEWDAPVERDDVTVRESRPIGVQPFDAGSLLKCPCRGRVVVYARLTRNSSLVFFEIRYQCSACRKGSVLPFRGNRYDARRDWLAAVKGEENASEVVIDARVVEDGAPELEPEPPTVAVVRRRAPKGEYEVFIGAGGLCSCGGVTLVERNGYFRARCPVCGKTGGSTPHLAEALCGVG